MARRKKKDVDFQAAKQLTPEKAIPDKQAFIGDARSMNKHFLYTCVAICGTGFPFKQYYR